MWLNRAILYHVAHCLFTTSAGRSRFELHAHNENYDLSNARTLKRMHFVVNPPVIRRIYEMSYLIGVVGFLRDTAHGKSPRTPSARGKGLLA
jgi:hypothetical protein